MPVTGIQPPWHRATPSQAGKHGGWPSCYPQPELLVPATAVSQSCRRAGGTAVALPNTAGGASASDAPCRLSSGATPACPQPPAPPAPRGVALNPALGLSGLGATDPLPCTPSSEADCFLQRGPGRSWHDACCGPPPCTAWRTAPPFPRSSTPSPTPGLLCVAARAGRRAGPRARAGMLRMPTSRPASTPIPALLWAGIPRRLRFVASLPLQARRNGFAPPAGAGSPRLESWEGGDSDGARYGPERRETDRYIQKAPRLPNQNALGRRRRREPPARTAGANRRR